MIKKDIIDFVYKNNILQLGTVPLKNGDYSDHFYNFGEVNTPDSLFQLSRWLVELIGEESFNVIFTSAYKGIPIQTGFALEYHYQYPFKSIHFGFQRKEAKPHGEGGAIVGYTPRKEDKVLLLDDVFTTGYSLLEMSQIVSSKQARVVLAVVSILRADDKTFAAVQKKLNVPILYLARDEEITSVYDQYRKR